MERSIQQCHVCTLGYCWKGRCGELPQSSPRYTDYGSAMTLYNTYYSIIRGAVSVVAPNEAAEAEEEQEESPDYKCALCEEFKDKPSP